MAAEVEDLLADWTEISTAMDVASEWEGAVESEMMAERSAIKRFADKSLQTGKDFASWVGSKIKGMSIGDMATVGLGGLMLYQMFKKDASQAERSGQMIKLSSAIAGARSTLVDNYDRTVHDVAVKTKADKEKWDKLTKEVQDALDGEIAETGDIFWAVRGPAIMELMAEAPIYDASS